MKAQPEFQSFAEKIVAQFPELRESYANELALDLQKCAIDWLWKQGQIVRIVGERSES